MENITQIVFGNVSTFPSNKEEWRKAQSGAISSGYPSKYEKEEKEEQEIRVVDNKIVFKQITFPERVSMTFQILFNIRQY